MIDPAGTERPLSLRRWSELHPEDFRLACDEAYGGYVEGDSQSDSDSADDLLSSIGASSLITLVGALAGAGAGYQLSKCSRADERRHQQALALQTDLSALIAKSDSFAQTVRSESDKGEERLDLRSRAVDLRSKIPTSSACAAPAKAALDDLVETLAKSKLDVAELEADLISNAGREVETTVKRLIDEI